MSSSHPLDFGFIGTWKGGFRNGEQVEVEWLHPWKLKGDKGFLALFQTAQANGQVVRVDGIPFVVDYWDRLSVRGFAEAVLTITERRGPWPELEGDRDRYLFPKVTENPKGLRKRMIEYPDSEQIAGRHPIPR